MDIRLLNRFTISKHDFELKCKYTIVIITVILDFLLYLIEKYKIFDNYPIYYYLYFS